jgi:hypothetical protein
VWYAEHERISDFIWVIQSIQIAIRLSVHETMFIPAAVGASSILTFQQSFTLLLRSFEYGFSGSHEQRLLDDR